MQNKLTSDQEHDPETGEIRDTLSDRASRNIQPRRHWDRLEGIVIRTPGEDQQSQYELAFLEAQSKIKAILEAEAKATVPTKSGAFTYSYASLGQVLNHVRPILHAHGFTLKQGTGRIHKMGLDGGNMLYLPVFTKFTYVGTCESETFVMEMPLVKVDAQAIGAATSYAKRYTLLGALGIATADDDAIAAITQKNFSRDDESAIAAGIIENIKGCKTIDALQKWAKQNAQALESLSGEIATRCRDAYRDHLDGLRGESKSDGK